MLSIEEMDWADHKYLKLYRNDICRLISQLILFKLFFYSYMMSLIFDKISKYEQLCASTKLKKEELNINTLEERKHQQHLITYLRNVKEKA